MQGDFRILNMKYRNTFYGKGMKSIQYGNLEIADAQVDKKVIVGEAVGIPHNNKHKNTNSHRKQFCKSMKW